MVDLFHDLIQNSATTRPDAEALCYQHETLTYASLAQQVGQIAQGFSALGLRRGDRLAIYLEKRFESVIAMFAATRSGGVFVPVNPVLKSGQVAHILYDCGAKILVTSAARFAILQPMLLSQTTLHTVVVVDDSHYEYSTIANLRMVPWDVVQAMNTHCSVKVIDNDMAAIIYTSGSTGKPKGVVFSHRNLVAGARSVSSYLHNDVADRILTVLPLSFDYGLSQLTTTFYVGATNVLMNYLLPRDILDHVKEYKITGLAAVPSLWIQLVALNWCGIDSLRYITNSGGAMPVSVIQQLRSLLPKTQVFLMYGFTEAFRSTYLVPEEIDQRPNSIGKAIPNAEVLVLRPDGTACEPEEPGELVHRGATVAMGYWNDREKTAKTFKPMMTQQNDLPLSEIVAWSGDTVKMDTEGFLYFIERRDALIKSSGYRISPTEIEEILYDIESINEVVAFGVPHAALGQGIVVIATTKPGVILDIDTVSQVCKNKLPAYMCPHHIEIWQSELPKNSNGKIDRYKLARSMQHIFTQVQ
ncbi:MAG TPA: acyl-CoA ligase (AMP-forming), exosortase A system-associated [Nitrosomonas sp.]|nr:acyl-CoA ligase (AMP-forming), exosortase A system-associated [Nitrosomonas sp.]HQX14282.1 acyl-CoA ligase (AMP-forming), exosortase A system-associated [Nitrosomonas sp.]HRB21772.1 acyl-CoA ligase (AMP-forming), exosortase A system-associated [Nitrosomonas sp.]HRB33332.1 acyl-CoA ligase (AMP-forming), exosortase A system-associated [Nitrosomonas sp.]HRB45944.1 acyl-CoA ligase (AMP-forming), exosortase A system-associated [Nitrosomonas sp.]